MLSSRGVLWDVLRPIAAWPMRSPARLLSIVAGVVVAMIIGSQVFGEPSDPVADGDLTEATSTTSPATPGSDSVAATAASGDDVQATTAPGDDVGATSVPPADGGGDDEVATATSAAAEAEPVGGLDDDHDHDGDGWVIPEAGESFAAPPKDAKETTIAATGVKAVRAMARPAKNVSEKTWWKRFSARLTDQAQQDYKGIDPASVPWAKVSKQTGQLLPSEGHSDLVQLVEVETDTGPVTAHVRRDGEGWAVSRISWSADGPAEAASG